MDNDFFLFRTKTNNKIPAGTPVMTLKLNGGISSSAILNKDQTELQTIIKKINKITVNKFLLFLILFFITQVSRNGTIYCHNKRKLSII